MLYNLAGSDLDLYICSSREYDTRHTHDEQARGEGSGHAYVHNLNWTQDRCRLSSCHTFSLDFINLTNLRFSFSLRQRFFKRTEPSSASLKNSCFAIFFLASLLRLLWRLLPVWKSSTGRQQIITDMHSARTSDSWSIAERTAFLSAKSQKFHAPWFVICSIHAQHVLTASIPLCTRWRCCDSWKRNCAKASKALK